METGVENIKEVPQITFFAEGKAKPVMGEVAASGNGANRSICFLPYNPDDLVRSKGKGLKIYQEMVREPHIKAALLQKKTKILNIGWDVIAASKDPRDTEIAAFVKWNLGTFLKGAFTRDLYEMLDAFNNGFSISEKVYSIVEKGRWKGKIAIENIKSKDPNYFDFQADQYGNLGKDGLVMRPESGGAQTKLPVGKFVIYSHLMCYENFYGTSDLRAAYRAFWLKDTAWKLRAVYMERYSGNNLKGKYPAKDEKAKEKLLEIFRTWQQETGIAYPEGVEIEVIQMATGSVSEYERSIDNCNTEIQIGILGQTLTMDVGKGGTGSRALGQVHDSVLDDYVLFHDELMKAEINTQIVKDLVDFNFDVDEYPVWTFKSREGFDGKAFSETIMNLARLKGVDIPVRYVKEKYHIPEPGEGEAIIKELQLGVGLQPGQSDAGQQPEPAPQKPVAKMSESVLAGPYHRPLNRYEIFSELPRIDKETSAFIDEMKAKSVPVYEAVKKDILSQVERKGVLGKKDYTGIEKVKADVGELKLLLADAFLRAYLMGRADIAKLADAPEKFAEDYVPDKALAALAKRAGITRDLFDQIVAEMRGQAFTVAGLEQATIEKEVKTLLLQSIKNGDDFKAFKFRLNEAFIKYSMPVYGNIGTVGQTILDHHAEVIFRTNVMHSYNQGRKEALADKDVTEAFPAWQYSAILDGRVRETHAAMDGKIFMADDPIWNRITPPNGYNCRCTIVPISQYDFTRDMLSSASDIPGGFPDSGFG